MQRYCGIVLSLILVANLASACEKITFINSQIAASKSGNVNEDDLIPITLINGCLEPGRGLEEAFRIVMVNQSVPILYEEAVKDLPNLQVLNIDFDGIKDIIPGAFQNLPALAELTLVGNKLKIIREGVFNNMNIVSLKLQNNSISIIEPGAFDNMPSLRSIEADFNKISQWYPSWFTNSPNVIRLSFTHNKITNLPMAAFQNINGVDETGKYAAAIFLANNKIFMIDSMAFQGLNQIGYLDLKSNSLGTLPVGVFSSLTKIGTLLLDDNKIKCLPVSFLNSLPQFDYFSADGNPWDCICLQNVKSWSKLHGKLIHVELSDAKCVEKKMKGIMDFVSKIKDMKAKLAAAKFGALTGAQDDTENVNPISM